jgi:hypothetical protein
LDRKRKRKRAREGGKGIQQFHGRLAPVPQRFAETLGFIFGENAADSATLGELKLQSACLWGVNELHVSREVEDVH